MSLTTLAASPTRRGNDIEGLLGFHRGSRHAPESIDAVSDALDLDIPVGNMLVSAPRATPLRSRVTAMSKPAELRPSASKKKTLVCPTATPMTIGAARGADDGIGDLGVGDQHVLDVARQVDDHGLADSERDEERAGIEADEFDHARRRLGGRRICGRRICGRLARPCKAEGRDDDRGEARWQRRRRGEASLWTLEAPSSSFRYRRRRHAEPDHVEAIGRPRIVLRRGRIPAF